MQLIAVPLLPLVVAFVALGLYLIAVEHQQSQAEAPSIDWTKVLRGGAAVATFGASELALAGMKKARVLLSRYALAKLAVLAAWFNAMGSLAARHALTFGSFAGTVAEAFDKLVTVYIPHAIATAVRPIGITARQALRIARSGRALARRAVAMARAAATRADHALDWSRRRTGELARDIAGLRGRVRSLDDWLAKNRDAIRKLRRLLTVAGFSALLIRALARRFPWLFCRKVNTIGKRACGLDPDFLQSLLGTTLLIAGSISLAEMARDLRGPAQLVEQGLTDLIRELN